MGSFNRVKLKERINKKMNTMKVNYIYGIKYIYIEGT